MKNFTVAALLGAIAVTTSAQAQTYEWRSEMKSCQYQGDFDNNKYNF